MTVSGWGTLSAGGSQPTELHSVNVPGITNDACKAKYGSSSITNKMLCAGNVYFGGVDSCQGDSGGKRSNNITYKLFYFIQPKCSMFIYLYSY